MPNGGGRKIEALRRVLLGRLALVRTSLAGRAPDDADVHSARRELKRARALLRVLRSALGRQAFHAVNRPLRDLGRELGAARDAAVLAALVGEAAVATDVSQPTLRRFLAALERERREKRAAIDVRAIRAKLDEARATLLAARLDGDAATLGDGFERIYRKGRAAFAAAREVNHPARLHEWRKHVKHYWHGLEALEPAWPRLMTALSGEAHHLADLLGTHHDALLLASRLRRARLPAPARTRLLAELGRRRRLLRAASLRIGARLYEEKPSRFAPRAEAWWSRWVEAATAARAVARRRARRQAR